MPISDDFDIPVMEESLFEDIPALRELERTLFAQECCVAPQTPWHGEFFEAVLLMQKGHDDRSSMLQKRLDAVKAIKGKGEYLMLMQARKLGSEEAQGAPLTSNFMDRSMSKRTWETTFNLWRRDLRAWRRNPPQFPLKAIDRVDAG